MIKDLNWIQVKNKLLSYHFFFFPEFLEYTFFNISWIKILLKLQIIIFYRFINFRIFCHFFFFFKLVLVLDSLLVILGLAWMFLNSIFSDLWLFIKLRFYLGGRCLLLLFLLYTSLLRFILILTIFRKITAFSTIYHQRRSLILLGILYLNNIINRLRFWNNILRLTIFVS